MPILLIDQKLAIKSKSDLIEVWQALLEKLGGNESSIASVILRGAIASSSYSSRLRCGKRCWRSWERMNERSLVLILPSAIASSNYSSRLRRPSLFSEALRQPSDLLRSLCKLSCITITPVDFFFNIREFPLRRNSNDNNA